MFETVRVWVPALLTQTQRYIAVSRWQFTLGSHQHLQAQMSLHCVHPWNDLLHKCDFMDKLLNLKYTLIFYECKIFKYFLTILLPQVISSLALSDALLLALFMDVSRGFGNIHQYISAVTWIQWRWMEFLPSSKHVKCDLKHPAYSRQSTENTEYSLREIINLFTVSRQWRCFLKKFCLGDAFREAQTPKIFVSCQEAVHWQTVQLQNQV